MDRERAETFLRLLAEEELRRVTAYRRDSAPPDVPDGEGEAAALLRRPAAAAMLRDLPDRQREAITLQYHAGLSEAETAATMRISRGAVKAHTGHGISMLRAEVEMRSHVRVRIVAQVLTGVGALDGQVADQILDDLARALTARQAHLAANRMGWLARWSSVRGRLTVAASGQAHLPGSAGPQACPGRVVPLGQLIAFGGADVAAELHLLSYARVASGPQLSVFARARGQSGLWEPSGPRLFDPFTAADDRGTGYQVTIRDIGSPVLGWTLMLSPDPPHDPRWLDLTTAPGGPAVRIDLDRRVPASCPPDAADVTVRTAALSPAEYLLHTMAARLLAAVPPPLYDPWLHPAGPRPRALPGITGELGDVIAALQECGALPPLSPVPGQLATLCAGLGIHGHGITAPPARDLPEPWLSLLACYGRRKTRPGPARDGCAAAAAVLPELDGIRLAILGLHNCKDSTVMHMHASGPNADAIHGPDDLYPWAIIWVRDSGGRWHATRTLGRSPRPGEVALRVEVVPPLSQGTAWIELLASGPSAELRATVPLHWE
jgi:Sigma-70, region 4